VGQRKGKKTKLRARGAALHPAGSSSSPALEALYDYIDIRRFLKPRRAVLARAWRLITTILVLLGGAIVLVTFTPAVRWIAAGLSEHWSDRDGDVLVVLGGSVVQDPSFPNGSMIGESSYWRAD
jgi:hypothetical protein